MREKNWFFGLVMLASLTITGNAFGDIWDEIGAGVKARKKTELGDENGDAKTIKPGNSLPVDRTVPVPVPDCEGYGVLFKFSFAIAGDHNFLHLLDPATTLESVVNDWKKNADKLTPNDYPDTVTDTGTWTLGEARDALTKLSGRLANKTIKFSDFLKSPTSYGSLWADLAAFRINFAPGLGCLAVHDEAKIKALAMLLTDGGLLLPLKESGIGDMTLTQLYHTPALSRDMVAPGEAYFNDITVSIVAQAQEIGFLVVPKDCGSNAPRAAAVPSCCCNNVNHGATKYRKCAPSSGSASCNMCGSACCLAGVTWCVAGHAVH